jgi:hypothetical protein
MRIHLSLLAAIAAGMLLAADAAQGRTAKIVFCKGTQLAGSFKVVPGSAGAGNIVYRLTLTNTSASKCSLTGLPVVQLLGRTGKDLPTHVRAAFPNALTAILVTIAHGRSTHANARFSPDVPGVGEQHPGACEKTSYSMRITAKGGGTTTVKVAPPTPVCERGQLQFSAYGR